MLLKEKQPGDACQRNDDEGDVRNGNEEDKSGCEDGEGDADAVGSEGFPHGQDGLGDDRYGDQLQAVKKAIQ